MTRLPLPAASALALPLALALAACGPGPATGSPESPESPGSPGAAAPAVAAPAPQRIDGLSGTGEPMPPAEPATDEVAATPGSDAEENQFFDFSGAALEKVRAGARPAPVPLREAARRLVDATAEERGCGPYPEGERLFVLDLDGRPGAEALLLYTMQGCGGGGTCYARAGDVLREAGDRWEQVAAFDLGTKLVGNAAISAIEPGVLVLSPDGDSRFEPARVEIPAP